MDTAGVARVVVETRIVGLRWMAPPMSMLSWVIRVQEKESGFPSMEARVR